MEVELPRPWKNLKVCIPLIIGSVPLRTHFDTFLPTLDTKEKNQSLTKHNYGPEMRKLGTLALCQSISSRASGRPSLEEGAEARTFLWIR